MLPVADNHAFDTYWEKDANAIKARRIVGRPLNSTLADLLGCAVAHEEWPAWINDLAREIESPSE